MSDDIKEGMENDEEPKIVDLNEYAAKKWDEAREEDLRKMQEYEQNYILTPLWEALTNIKSSRQAINAAMGMLITAKDILVLELGKEDARRTVGSMNYDVIDLVSIEKRDGNAQGTGYDLQPVDESYPAPDNDNVTPLKSVEDDDEKDKD
tara:strand:- start:110 stop:559 length:450 start_codon:yes stop_codon:yes gene_type:complete